MSNTEWEEVVVPRGSFIGWGEVGQQVTGYVVSYSDTDGSDFNDQPCPQVVLELTEKCISYRDKGTTKETIDAGEFVTITCGQASLRKGIKTAALEVGYIVRVKYESTYKTAKGEGKEFKVFVSRAKRAAVSSNDLV